MTGQEFLKTQVVLVILPKLAPSCHPHVRCLETVQAAQRVDAGTSFLPVPGSTTSPLSRLRQYNTAVPTSAQRLPHPRCHFPESANALYSPCDGVMTIDFLALPLISAAYVDLGTGLRQSQRHTLSSKSPVFFIRTSRSLSFLAVRLLYFARGHTTDIFRSVFTCLRQT